MKFRFTSDEDIHRYGPGWMVMVGETSMPNTAVRSCKAITGLTLAELLAKAKDMDLEVLDFLLWASVVAAGHQVTFDDFRCDLLGIDFDLPAEPPQAEPKAGPGVNPTSKPRKQKRKT